MNRRCDCGSYVARPLPVVGGGYGVSAAIARVLPDSYPDPFNGKIVRDGSIDRTTSVYHAAEVDVRNWAYIHLMDLANETRKIALVMAENGKHRGAQLQMSAASAYRHAAMEILLHQDLTDGRVEA